MSAAAEASLPRKAAEKRSASELSLAAPPPLPDGGTADADSHADDDTVGAPNTVPPKKKQRRNKDPLADTKHQQRYAAATLKGGEGVALLDQGLTHGDPRARFRRARKAVAASRIPFEIAVDDERDELVERDVDNGRISASMAAARRHAIEYLYRRYRAHL